MLNNPTVEVFEYICYLMQINLICTWLDQWRHFIRNRTLVVSKPRDLWTQKLTWLSRNISHNISGNYDYCFITKQIHHLALFVHVTWCKIICLDIKQHVIKQHVINIKMYSLRLKHSIKFSQTTYNPNYQICSWFGHLPRAGILNYSETLQIRW